MSINQQRLSYTRRDLISLDGDIANYIKEFIPRITDTSQVNTGRVFLTANAALIDNLNMSLDQVHIETLLKQAKQRKNILEYVYTLGYTPKSVSPASVDLTFSMLSGVAPPGGQAIPIYTRCQTIANPILEILTVEATSIPEGFSSISGVSALQGIQVTAETLVVSASGNTLQSYKISNPKVVHTFVEVTVSGSIWTQVDNFSESEYNDQHYTLSFDDEDFTYVNFGDGIFGACPPTGVAITVTYIYTSTLNIAANQIIRVIGSLASTIGVINPIGATGGDTSESNDSMKINAPAFNRSSNRIVTSSDAVSFSKQVPGVYDAFAISSGGAKIDVYVVPSGGGAASSYLLAQVLTFLNARKMEGMRIYTHSLNAASLLMTVNVIIFNSKVQKSTVKSKVKTAITSNLSYDKLKYGRGFALSDSSGFIEEIDNKTLVDYCDFVVHSRKPTVTKSNLSAIDIRGSISVGVSSGYDTYVITAISTTQFMVSKNGIPQGGSGTVGSLYTSNNSEISFTLGIVGDTIIVGDTWLFKTSKYKDNIYLDSDEFLTLTQDSDLIINVYYPNEYSMTTQSGI